MKSENNSKITEVLRAPEDIKLTDVDTYINSLAADNTENRERALLELDGLMGKLQNHLQLLSIYLKQRYLLPVPAKAPVETNIFYTKQEIAVRYRVSTRTVGNWISMGMKSIILGGVLRVSEDAILEFVKTHPRRKYNWKSIARYNEQRAARM